MIASQCIQQTARRGTLNLYLARLAVLQHNLVNLLEEVIRVSPIIFIKYASSTHWHM